MSNGSAILATDEWLANLAEEDIATAFDELVEGKYLLLSDEQSAFFETKDPDEIYTAEQIFYMQHTPNNVVLQHKIDRVKDIRRALYKSESDPLYIEYQKDLALGDFNKADETKEKWIAKVQEIEENNPYPTE